MTERSFDTAGLTRAAADTFTVRRVFGEAYQHASRLVVPVARVTGATGSGAGAGSGEDRSAAAEPPTDTGHPSGRGPHGTADGGGGGFGARVRPVGVVVVDDDGVRWHPTVDVNRIVLGGQVALTVVATAWALAWAVRRR